jgi:hypothetical protein
MSMLHKVHVFKKGPRVLIRPAVLMAQRGDSIRWVNHTNGEIEALFPRNPASSPINPDSVRPEPPEADVARRRHRDVVADVKRDDVTSGPFFYVVFSESAAGFAEGESNPCPVVIVED